MFNLISEVKPAVLSILLGSVLGFTVVHLVNSTPELPTVPTVYCTVK